MDTHNPESEILLYTSSFANDNLSIKEASSFLSYVEGLPLALTDQITARFSDADHSWQLVKLKGGILYGRPTRDRIFQRR